MALTSKPKSGAAQDFLPIETVRDGTVVLRAGAGLRAVLMASSLNFALKSDEEQDALVYQYENFLNSLDFPLQFVIQSRRLNIRPYLDTLVGRQKEETNELLKIQIGEYAEFVRSFVELSNIVTKAFFIVVPFAPSIKERGGGLIRRITDLMGSRAEAAAGSDAEFVQYRDQLLQRVDAVVSGLRRLGLRTARLGTDELIELYYGLYNPTESQPVRAESGERT